ncbi:MAG: hypothetical protein MJE66_14415 [Proteobacteria bacterium]|nr:hypothetical protein [Pseudomonadota bacterium]
MPWWVWIVTGTALMGAEIVVALDFYLFFIGVAAVLEGLLLLAGLDAPPWVQWLSVSAFFAIEAGVYQFWVKDRITQPDPLSDGVAGQQAIAVTAMAPGARGKAEQSGAQWDAHNVGDAAIEAGERCLIERTEGLTLCVRRID